MATLYQLFRPVAFLRLSGPSLTFYKFILPIVVTTLAAILYLLMPIKIDLVGERSAADYMANFFATLPGFFIAALAAVVAFQGGDLDKEMPDVKVSITVQGDTKPVPITFRVFLCYLFSYLTVLSFLGFFVCVGGSLICPILNHFLSSISDASTAANIRIVLEVGYASIITFITASVVLCTFQGLYFLAERVHQKLL